MSIVITSTLMISRKKIQTELPENKTLDFKRQLQFIILGDDKIRIWVPEGKLYFALMNVLQMFPMKNG